MAIITDFINYVKMQPYIKLANRVEFGFKKPKFIRQDVGLANTREEADIRLNPVPTVQDYIVLGFVCLLHSINEDNSMITVYYDYPKTEKIKIFNEDQCIEKFVDCDLFLQIKPIIDEIYSKLYTGKYTVSGVGLTTSLALITHFAEIEGIPDSIMKKIKHSYFGDTITAQKDAFILLKYIVGRSVAGIYYSNNE